MLRVALLVSLGLVAVQAQSDASLPSQRAERIARGIERVGDIAADKLAEVRQRIAAARGPATIEARPSAGWAAAWRERRGADARSFDAVDEAAELQRYANNYDGRTPNRYDSVNPTYRTSPPAGLVCYGTARGCGYLDYKKDPYGRWGFNAADEEADNAVQNIFNAVWRQGQAPQVQGRDFERSINRQGDNWNLNGNVKYDSKREGLPAYDMNFNFGKPRQLSAEEADSGFDWRRVFGNQDFDRSFERRGANWDASGNVQYDAKQDGFPGYDLNFNFGKPRTPVAPASFAAEQNGCQLGKPGCYSCNWPGGCCCFR